MKRFYRGFGSDLESVQKRSLVDTQTKHPERSDWNIVTLIET